MGGFNTNLTQTSRVFNPFVQHFWNLHRKGSLNFRLCVSVTYSLRDVNQRAANAVQWHHHSLTLIHAKSKTRFSIGKWRNIVSICLHSTELLYFQIIIHVKHSNSLTACSTVNKSFACIAPWFNYQTQWWSCKNEINTHTGHFKTTTICFNLKEANWSASNSLS